MTTTEITRRDLLRKGVAGAAFGAAALAVPGLASAAGNPESVYQLQAAFHQAKTSQDLDLMMSLWADDATFVNRSTGTTYVGFESIKSFWQGSGSFTHHRFSLVPSYKTKIDVDGDEAFLYFECHDVGDYDLPTRAIAGDTFLAGTVRRVQGTWVFWDMAAGPSAPLAPGGRPAGR